MVTVAVIIPKKKQNQKKTHSNKAHAYHNRALKNYRLPIFSFFIHKMIVICKISSQLWCMFTYPSSCIYDSSSSFMYSHFQQNNSCKSTYHSRAVKIISYQNKWWYSDGLKWHVLFIDQNTSFWLFLFQNWYNFPIINHPAN